MLYSTLLELFCLLVLAIGQHGGGVCGASAFAGVPPLARRSRCRRLRADKAQSRQDFLKTMAGSPVEFSDLLPNPNPSLSAVDVVTACMDTLVSNSREAGLEVCFVFSSGRCRAAIGGSLENFNEYANNPTFGYLINCASWQILSVGPIIEGTPHRGSMQTILIVARPPAPENNSDDGNHYNRGIRDLSRKTKKGEEKEEDGRMFLWTLQMERRPPLQDCWMVHEVLFTKNAYLQTI